WDHASDPQTDPGDADRELNILVEEDKGSEKDCMVVVGEKSHPVPGDWLQRTGDFGQTGCLVTERVDRSEGFWVIEAGWDQVGEDEVAEEEFSSGQQEAKH